MSAEKKQQLGVLGLIVALIVVLVGSLVFVGAVSGWFDDPKTVIDAEYRCTGEDCGLIELSSADMYNELVKAEKSFVVLIDQDGCKTAEKLKGFLRDWSENAHYKAYRMMFAEMKESVLHETVKYYPSVVIVSMGEVKAFLRADSDEDAAVYNDNEAFTDWIQKYVVVENV